MRELEYPFDSTFLLQNKRSLRRKLLETEGLTEKKIAVLCGPTVGEMKNMLELFLLNQGIRPVFWEGQYDRFYEEVLFDNRELTDFGPDIVYIHTTSRSLKELPEPAESPEDVEKRLERELTPYRQVWDKLLTDMGCTVIQNNFEPLPFRVLGNADAWIVSGGRAYVDRLNGEIYRYARTHRGFYVNDLAYEASCHGLDAWYDEAVFCLYKYPFAVDAIPSVAFNIANIIKSSLGRNKKALALDLDNTLWGGVVGDDGAENLKVGIETPEGMAFSEFQKYIKRLGGMGVTLNVCSKNEEEAARNGFENSGCVLNLDDFVVFKANWENKDKNLREIARELNIGEEALVFLDDNPAERALARQRVPGAAVPELGAPETYLRILDRSGYFEVTTLSEDDRKRNEYYKANLARQEVRDSFASYEEYLLSLKMSCVMDGFHERNLERVTQLINKTNQFNLTARRLSLEEVESFTRTPGNICICGQLFDRFGDNGIVSVIMAKPENTGGQDAAAGIFLWVMSCRVFKRELETAMFDELLERCVELGYRRIRGYYRRTGKNHLTENFYRSLGFDVIEQDEEHGVFEYVIPENRSPVNRVMERKKA